MSRYSYHHGYYDGEEREFRGFARVETLDAEDFAEEGSDALLYQPPVRTVSWYHTGAWLEKERLEYALREEYFQGGPPSLLVNDNPPVHELQENEIVFIERLSTQDAREAARALKGSLLRREVYAQDGSEQEEIPYVITETNQAVRRLQPSRGENRYGVFFAYAQEAVTVTSERNLSDPRVVHELVLDADRYGAVTRKASVAYGRDPAVSEAQPEQTRPYVTLTEATYAHQDDPAGSVYRLGTQIESRTYEVTGLVLPNPGTVTDPPTVGSALAEVEALRAALDDPAVVDIDFDGAPGTGVVRRLLARKQQTFYVDSFTVADAEALEPSASLELPLGEVGERALPYRTYQLALTAGHVSQLVNDSTTLTGSAFDPTLLTSEGRYVEREGNGQYWAVSPRAVFDPEQFYHPVVALDAFGGIARVQWDAFGLLPVSATDPVGNRTESENDYRVLAPYRITDPNLNRAEVAFDALGMVVATAVMGKDDGSAEGDTLDDPTMRLEYDLLAYQERGEPAVVHTIAREQHGPTTPETRFQHSYTYSDGFGRVVMQKVQAEPGEAPLRDANGELERDPQTGELTLGHVPERWVGTGRTIFNNKGNPVKQYEPFFSSTSAFENEADLVEWGVTPIIRYDSIDRVVRTELPDGSFTRVKYDPWEQRTFDQNDTVIDATGELSPWYTERGAPDPNGAEPSDAEARAAWLAAQHANTPTTVYLDSLGRPFLSVAHNRTSTGTNRVDAYSRTRTVLDIEGNPLAVYDARQHDTSTPDNHTLSATAYATIEQTFDVLQRRLRVLSADAGTRVAVQDTANRPLRSYDSRGFTGRTQFDAAQRPTHVHVAQGGSENLVARMVYGEELDSSGPSTDPTNPSAAQALNLRGQVRLGYDGAGVARTEQADFKGNVLRAIRRLATSYQQTPTWDALSAVDDPTAVETAAEPLLEPEVFETQSTFDALSRIVTHTAPASSALANAPSVTRYEYNEASLLEAVYVTARGGPEETVISDIDYNARGQRLRCEHAATTGTPAHTIAYTYDPNTFRVVTITTTRSAAPATLQALSYTYDAVGNIVAKRDDANWDPDLANALGGGSNRYQYDALYRLTRATGREHAGQQVDASDPLRGSIPHGNDLSALRDYVELTTYDEVGNIIEMRHLTGPSNSQSWSRRYSYASNSNRLLATSVPGDPDGSFSATYGYENTATNNAGAHGSMTSMPHLEVLQWDYADRLQHTLRSNGSNQHTYFTYAGTGKRVRKVYVHNGIADERIYLGDVELFRRRSVDGSGNLGTVSVERETLHVMDDTRRLAMAETLTVDTGGTEPIAVGQPRWRYQLDDHLGSAAMELDDAAQVISYEEYHPYGSTAFHLFSGSAEVSAKRYRYTGKEKDDETGLYYHGARYYAPWLGRWTAADPAGLVDGLNLYRYSRDNPVRFSDPGGTQTTEPSTRRNLGQYEFTGKETRQELEALANAEGYTILGTPEWEAKRGSWELGGIQRVDSAGPSEVIAFEQELITPGGAAPEPTFQGSVDEESLGEQLLRGAVLGDFGGEATVASVTGQVLVGLTPLGVAADVRDFAAALKDLNEGRPGAGVGVVLAGIGFLPFGDIAKMLRKGDDLIDAGTDAARLADDVPSGPTISGGGPGGGGGAPSPHGGGGASPPDNVWIATEEGIVLPPRTDIDAVPSAAPDLRDPQWAQVHSSHSHRGDPRAHAHGPEPGTGRRVDVPLAETMRRIDEGLRSGALRMRRSRSDRGGR